MCIILCVFQRQGDALSGHVAYKKTNAMQFNGMPVTIRTLKHANGQLEEMMQKYTKDVLFKGLDTNIHMSDIMANISDECKVTMNNSMN